MSAAPTDLPAAIDALTAALRPGDLITDAAVRSTFERDWTGRFGAECLAVARPRNTEEVATVIGICRDRGLKLVPQGGNTGLVGGGVPQPSPGPPHSVVISLTGLDAIGEIDLASAQVEVGAGVTLADLQDAAASQQMSAGLDLAARDSATVGGLVACDAGGINAIRYGTARNMVAGLEAVTGDGEVFSRISGLEKDNAGFAIPDLLIGSEGTLGVITKVCWKLVPRLPGRATALVGLDRVDQAVELLRQMRSRMTSIEAFEFVMGSAFELAREHLGRNRPLDGPVPGVFVLIDCIDEQSPIDQLAEELDRAGVERAALVDDSAARESLWECRERLTEVISSIGVPLKLDVGVPVRNLPEFISGVETLVRDEAPAARTVLFGHLGDGNVHVNILGGGDSEPEIAGSVIELVLRNEGTISAEHGIGASKAAWLERALGPEEVNLMRGLKSVLDPHGILNPGVVFP